ncbi:MAG: caspase family protein, partial [Treponema sp.]|nr:caspase family protein [Treponema sp.]
MKKIFALLAVLMAALTAFSAETDEKGGVERFAIFAGSNSGGNNQKLLYAGSDAIAFQKTMCEIGGIPESNGILLLDPVKDELDEALERISQMINRRKAQSCRLEFLFYYSGHSDENALLLGKTEYDYSSLKAAISRVPSDVHVVILDSCYSGNFIRTKGGQRKKPFLMDDSSVVKGHAYLSSSSSQEFSQESDEIGSSFFTNAMLTGLRGAADSSGDKKITLNELYSYAFSETLSKTENTSAGPQHPNYNITLVGSGDLVLSDISGSDSIVMLTKELEGRVILRDRKGKLVSEINKAAGSPVLLALEKGDYSAVLILEKETLQGNFSLGKNKVYELSGKSFTKAVTSANRLRGSGAEDKTEDDENPPAESPQNGEVYIPFEFSFVCNEVSMYLKKSVNTSFSLAVIRSRVNRVNVGMVSAVGNEAAYLRGIQAAGVYNIAEKNTEGGQAAGIFNITDRLTGGQAAGVFNMASDFEGVQAAGVFNIASDFTGTQAAGVFNSAKNFYGAQIAGTVNIASDFTGVQVSSVANSAGSFSGAQIAAVANVAQSAGQLQLASVVNIASSAGENSFQIGVINVALEGNPWQIGLINYSRSGIFETGLSWTTNDNVRASLTSGNKRLYSVLGYAARRKYFFSDDSDDGRTFTCFAGLGTRIPLGMFSIDFDGMVNWVFNQKEIKDAIDNKTDYSVPLYGSAGVKAVFKPV